MVSRLATGEASAAGSAAAGLSTNGTIALVERLEGSRKRSRGRGVRFGFAGRGLETRGAPNQSPVNEPIKRCFDIPFSLAVIFFLAPLLLLIAILVKTSGSGPVIYSQWRYGKNRTLFKVYKFRTMVFQTTDIEGPTVQAKRKDDRVTGIGAFLRRTSLDELPQFLNVLKGDMSVVGPRPHAPHTVIGDQTIEDILDEYDARHCVRPGVTGLAQVSGFRGPIQNLQSARKRFEYDVEYTRRWSFWLDVKIILLTIKHEFFTGSGY